MKINLKTWFWVHKWTSLICTLFMLLLCLTGLPMIFGHEIDEALGNTPSHREEQPDLPRKSIDALVTQAQTDRPGEVVKFIIGDPDDEGLWFFSLGKSVDDPETTSFLGYDAYSGELLSDYPLDGGLMSIITHLHVDLFAGIPGMLFLGLMGFLLVLSILSGVVLYAPFMKHVEFAEIRTQKSSRTQWLDVHNFLGIVTLIWFFGVSVTGVINTLSAPIFGLWQQTELAEMTAPYLEDKTVIAEYSTEAVVQAALANDPDKRLSFMAFPGNAFASPRHFVAFMAGKTPFESKMLTPLLLDATDAEVVDQRELPWYATLLLLSQPLHFGDYAGMPLKILWALLDLLSIVILVSGLVLWLTKRQDFNGWLAARKGASA